MYISLGIYTTHIQTFTVNQSNIFSDNLPQDITKILDGTSFIRQSFGIFLTEQVHIPSLRTYAKAKFSKRRKLQNILNVITNNIDILIFM